MVVGHHSSYCHAAWRCDKVLSLTVQRIPVRELALFVVYLKSGGSGKCAVVLSQLLR